MLSLLITAIFLLQNFTMYNNDKQKNSIASLAYHKESINRTVGSQWSSRPCDPVQAGQPRANSNYNNI